MADKRTGAEDLRERVAFDKRSSGGDGAGGTTTTFAEQFVLWTGFTHRLGGETVTAARLDGRHQVVMRVRSSTQSRLIDTDWRARHTRGGKTTIYAVRDVHETTDHAFIDILCESGAAP